MKKAVLVFVWIFLVFISSAVFNALSFLWLFFWCLGFFVCTKKLACVFITKRD